MHENLRSFLVAMLDGIDAGRRNRRKLTPEDVPVTAEVQISRELEDLKKAGLIDRIIAKTDLREDAPGAIEILDPDGLATLLRHRRHPQRLRDAIHAINLASPVGGRSMLSIQAWELIHELWADQRSAFGIPLSDSNRVALLLKFLDAIFHGEHIGKDARQFSTAIGQGSKDFEAIQGPLFRCLKTLLSLDDRADVAAEIGLVRHGQPILISGPIRLDGQSLPADPYIGLAPEIVGRIAPGPNARYLLTIENLATFHRFIREVQDGGISVFTGGFPSPSVLTAIKRAATVDIEAYHWGDIDAGGVTIFRTIEVALNGRLKPHLMSPDLAASSGSPLKLDRRLSTIADSDSAIAPLARWLMEPNARRLEQEYLDPVSPILP